MQSRAENKAKRRALKCNSGTSAEEVRTYLVKRQHLLFDLGAAGLALSLSAEEDAALPAACWILLLAAQNPL
jgi:hypothetical protein